MGHRELHFLKNLEGSSEITYSVICYHEKFQTQKSGKNFTANTPHIPDTGVLLLNILLNLLYHVPIPPGQLNSYLSFQLPLIALKNVFFSLFS